VYSMVTVGIGCNGDSAVSWVLGVLWVRYGIDTWYLYHT